MNYLWNEKEIEYEDLFAIVNSMQKRLEVSDPNDLILAEGQLTTAIKVYLEVLQEDYLNDSYKQVDDWSGIFNTLSLAYFHLATCRIKLGKYDLAKKDAWKAAEVMPHTNLLEYFEACDKLYQYSDQALSGGLKKLFSFKKNLVKSFYNKEVDVELFILQAINRI